MTSESPSFSLDNLAREKSFSAIGNSVLFLALVIVLGTAGMRRLSRSSTRAHQLVEGHDSFNVRVCPQPSSSSTVKGDLVDDLEAAEQSISLAVPSPLVAIPAKSSEQCQINNRVTKTFVDGLEEFPDIDPSNVNHTATAKREVLSYKNQSSELPMLAHTFRKLSVDRVRGGVDVHTRNTTLPSAPAALPLIIAELDKTLESLDAGLSAIASMQKDIENVLGECIHPEHESGPLLPVSGSTAIKAESSIHSGSPVISPRLCAHPDVLLHNRMHRSSKQVDEPSPSGRIKIIGNYPPVFNPAEFRAQSSVPNIAALLAPRACVSPEIADVQRLLKPKRKASLGTNRNCFGDHPPIFNPVEIQAESSMSGCMTWPFSQVFYSEDILPQENAPARQNPIIRPHITAGLLGDLPPIFDPTEIQAESSPRNLAAILALRSHAFPDRPQQVNDAENQAQSSDPNLTAIFPPRSDIHRRANMQWVSKEIKGVSHTRFDSKPLPVFNAEEVQAKSSNRLRNLAAPHVPRSCVSSDIHADVRPLLQRDEEALWGRRPAFRDDCLPIFNPAEIRAESTPNRARFYNLTPYCCPRKDALRLMKHASLGRDANVSIAPVPSPRYDVFGLKLMCEDVNFQTGRRLVPQ